MLALCVASVSLGADAAAIARTRNYTVIMEAVSFRPDTLTLRLGDTVTWKNNDPFPHTAVAVNGAFKSGNIAAGASWKYTVRTKGSFPYLCTLHSTMKAVLIVQ